MKKTIMILIIFLSLYISGCEKDLPIFQSERQCSIECLAEGYNSGSCVWEIESGNFNKRLGFCNIKGSEHCDSDVQCYCYCQNI